MIVIYNRKFDIFNFIVCCPWQDQQLYYRHDQDDPQDGRITEYLAEFFA